MPIIFVHGIPADVVKVNLLKKCLKEATAEVEELHLKSKFVSCFFPGDLLPQTGEEIIIFVTGLDDKKERTERVRNNLAEALKKVTLGLYKDAKLIECLIFPFYPVQGFASHRM